MHEDFRAAAGCQGSAAIGSAGPHDFPRRASEHRFWIRAGMRASRAEAEEIYFSNGGDSD